MPPEKLFLTVRITLGRISSLTKKYILSLSSIHISLKQKFVVHKIYLLLNACIIQLTKVVAIFLFFYILREKEDLRPHKRCSVRAWLPIRLCCETANNVLIFLEITKADYFFLRFCYTFSKNTQ